MFKINFGNYYELFCPNVKETEFCMFGLQKPSLMGMPEGKESWLEDTITKWWNELHIGFSKGLSQAIKEIKNFIIDVEREVSHKGKVDKKMPYRTWPSTNFNIDGVAHTDDKSLITCYFFIGTFGTTKMSVLLNIHKR